MSSVADHLEQEARRGEVQGHDQVAKDIAARPPCAQARCLELLVVELGEEPGDHASVGCRTETHVVRHDTEDPKLPALTQPDLGWRRRHVRTLRSSGRLEL